MKFLDLPPEMIAEIFARCSNDEKHTLRLTCKQIVAATTPAIRKAHKIGSGESGESEHFVAEDEPVLRSLPGLKELRVVLEVAQEGAETYTIPEPNFDPNPFAKDDDMKEEETTGGDASDPWAALQRVCCALPSLSGLRLRVYDMAPLQADEASRLLALTALAVSPSEWFNWDAHLSRSEPEFVPSRLEGLWCLSTLRSLALIGSRRGNTHRLALSDDDVSLMAGLTQLRSLCIERFSIECDGDPRLDQLSALTALTALSVHHAMLYSYGDSVLAAVSALSSLRSLDLSYVQRVSFRGSPPALELSMLSSLRQLSHLDISASSFLTDAAMPFIAACSALRSLILSAGDPSAPRPAPLPVHGCGISDEGLGALASLTRLTTLCLRWNGHLGWKGVAKLSGLRDLHALDMGDTGIALEGAEEAAAGLRVLAGMDGLRSLAVPLLYSGPLDSSRAHALLSSLGALPKLSVLDLSDTLSLSAAAELLPEVLRGMQRLSVVALGSFSDTEESAGNGPAEAVRLACPHLLPRSECPLSGAGGGGRSHTCSGNCVLAAEWVSDKEVRCALGDRHQHSGPGAQQVRRRWWGDERV